MLIPANDKVVITSAITIRSKILILMVLLLVTRALSMLYARACGAKKAVVSDRFLRNIRARAGEFSAYGGTRMKVPSITSNRSTKRSNLIRERPLTNRRDLIRPDFRGAGIQFPTTQRFARSARELFIPPAKPLEICFFKPFEVK